MDKENKLDWDHLWEILDYDTNTGIFTNKVNRSQRSKIEDIAGTKGSHGYIIITILGKKYRAHRLAWFYEYGKWPVNLIDHIDGNKENNAITNLREASESQNSINAKLRKDGTSNYKGVHRTNHGTWAASIGINNKTIRLGTFKTEKEAAIAYNKKALEVFGDYAKPNIL